MGPSSDRDTTALRLAERLIQLLDRGGFTATYKYAVLVGLMDLCMERTGASGAPPEVVTTRQLAEKVIELYWPHCEPYPERGVLRQNASRRKTHAGKVDTQAEIIRHIQRFRDRLGASPGASVSLARARRLAGGDAYERLARTVEWKLIEYPLPRLQNIGREEERFLYQYYFTKETPKSAVDRYQSGEGHAFDNRLAFQPGVGAALVALNGVLRPLIHRSWALMVANVNGIEEPTLERFLFGVERASLEPVRPALRALQKNLCFYCGSRVPERCHVDHFIPWSRHADNGLDNLVAAHEDCNLRKSDYLADDGHVERWRERSELHASALRQIAHDHSWEVRPERTFGVARSIYHMLPEDARLWHARAEFVKIEKARITSALALAPAA
ncbi:MAG: HNH endonuclease domain-containing protein [Polyangiaceae bacterium]